MINATLKNAKILIIDDNLNNIEMLVELLHLQEYKNIESTTDSRLAMSIYESYKPDLILLDLMMPHLSGQQILHQLKKIKPEGSFIPILVLTAQLSEVARKEALTLGANDFVSKPFDLTEVALRIRNLLYTRYLFCSIEKVNAELSVTLHETKVDLGLTQIDLLLAEGAIFKENISNKNI
jgi:DNA-binding response OmpR family regulator